MPGKPRSYIVKSSVEFPTEAIASGWPCRVLPPWARVVQAKHLVQDPRGGQPSAGFLYTAALSAAETNPESPSSKVTPIYVAQRPRRRPTRRRHVSLRPAVPAGPSRLRCGDLVRHQLAGHRDLCVIVCRADVCNRGRLPSLFLASGVCDRPGVSVHPGLPRAEHRAEERFVVGRQAPTPSSAFRY